MSYSPVKQAFYSEVSDMDVKIFGRRLFGAPDRIKVRTLRLDMWSGREWPKCAWCKIEKLILLADVVQQGQKWDIVSTVAYCDACQMTTIIVYEAPAGDALQAGGYKAVRTGNNLVTRK